MNRFLLTSILILFAVNITTAQQKIPITHESMWMLKRVGAPAISPDGKWVLFTVTDPSYDEKEVVNDLWIVPADGSVKPRRITSGKSAESGYQWSPDSKFIVFSAKRDGDEVTQLYVLNFKEGGEAQRITNLSTGAATPFWSPDGKFIAFTSKVFPGAFTDSANKKIAEEKKKLKYKARVYTTYPIRYWDQWLDEKQIHIFIQPFGSDSAAKDIFTDAGIVKKEGYHFGGGFAWGSDSREIIFTAAIDYTTWAYQNYHSSLYKVSISGGDPVLLTADRDDYGNPAISPDGKYLFCYASATTNYKVYELNKLVRFNWPSMQNKTILSPALDRVINSFVLAADHIYMSVEDQGHDRLYSLPFDGGTAALLSTGATGCYTGISVSDDGKQIVSDYESAIQPPEIVRINSATGDHIFISDFNGEKLKMLDLSPVEEFWFTSSRGRKIRSMIVRPAKFDIAKKYPLFVMMHGGPASSSKDNWSYRWNYQLLTAPGYVLLTTDYIGSTGYGEKFSQDIQYDPLKGPGDEINEGAREAIKKFAFIDASKQVAAGASYGGHLAMWMEATTTHYKCIVNHAGMVNSESQWGTSDVIYNREVMNGGPPWISTKSWKDQNSIKYAGKFKTPMLVTVGENDFRVPLNNSIESWSTLQRMKVPSKLIVFPEENHWILKPEDSRFWYSEMQEWVKSHLR